MSPVEFLLNLFANIAGEIILAILAVAAGIVAFHYRGLASKMWSGRKTTSPGGEMTAHESNGEIYISKKSGKIINLTHNVAMDIRPLWSQDERWVAFQSNRDGGDWNVYVADIDSGRVAQITRIRGTERAIGWDMSGNLHVDLGGGYLTVRSDEIERKLK